jgi:hypothetical protein
MAYFVTISNCTSSAPYELFEGETFDAAMEKAAQAAGGHPSIETGIVRSRSGFGGEFERNALPDTVMAPPPVGQPDAHQRRENESFWLQVMSDIFDGRDNEDWFGGTNREAVIAYARRWHDGEETE